MVVSASHSTVGVATTVHEGEQPWEAQMDREHMLESEQLDLLEQRLLA